MNVVQTALPGVLVIEPAVFGDERGFFMETWQAERYAALNIPEMVQDNLSRSSRGVLRGLHFQEPGGQGKLVQVLEGEVFDVAVDIRRGSPSWCSWHGVRLSAENRRQFWIPAGFAHGFVVLSDFALFAYKCTAVYQPEFERTIRWNDPNVGIQWPIGAPTLSARDANAALLSEMPMELFPAFS